MKNKFCFHLILLFISLTTSAIPQIEYYGYWDCKQFFKDELAGKVDIPNNSGVAMQWEYIEVVDNSLPGKKLLINSTDYFFYDENLNGRPDLEEINDSILWNKKLIKFKNEVLKLNQQKYNEACLGLIIAEEPLGFVSKNYTIRDNEKAAPIFENLKYTESGNFSNLNNNSPWDDILLFYYDKAKQLIEVEIMKSSGSGFSDPGLCLNKSNSDYTFDKIKFITTGDYNGDTFADLAIFYEGNLENQIHIFYSNGETLDSTYIIEFSLPKNKFDINNIKFVTSGNFNGVDGDEIAIFYRTELVSTIYVFSKSNNTYSIWYEENNSGWDINTIRFITSGNFDGRNNNKTSEIAVLNDYQSSSKSRIQIFRGDDKSYPKKFWGYENWLETDYNDLNFNYVRGFLKGDVNYDKNDDLIILYDTPTEIQTYGTYQRVMRYLSDPNEEIINSRLKYAGMMRNDFFRKNVSHFSFDYVKFALSGDFLINYSNGDPPILRDSLWITNPNNNNRIDDLIYFWEYSKDHQRIECFISKPHLMFGNKKVLAQLSNRIKSVLNKPTMILYTEQSTYIPDVFVTEADWIGTDPYPFTKSTNPDFVGGKNQIDAAISNIIRNTNNNIFLVGQAASDKGKDPGSMRFPSADETYYYFEVAEKYNRVKALYWWWYPDLPKSGFDGSSSKGGESILNEQKIIGEKIISK